MEAYESINRFLGTGVEPKDLTFLQISIRAVLVFILALVVVRVANKRFLAKMTAFDALLGFILASMLSRAINGSAPFFPTLGAGFIVVAVHALLAQLSYRSDKLGAWIKGRSQTIIEDGKPVQKVMDAAKISQHDLLEEARLNGKVNSLTQIQLATLERNGMVSVIRKE